MNVKRINSGGQTGGDRGGLDAAIELGISHGGWCPRGRRAEDGRIPDRYQLTEHTSADYLPRTQQNVEDADATIIFTMGALTGGSYRTVEFARRAGKPYEVVNLAAAPLNTCAYLVRCFLNETRAEIVNIAGPRESKAPGVALRVRECLLAALRWEREATAAGADAVRAERRAIAGRLARLTQYYALRSGHAVEELFVKLDDIDALTDELDPPSGEGEKNGR